MLRIAADFSRMTIGAGEAFIHEIQLLLANGSSKDVADTSMILTLYQPGSRETAERIEYERLEDDDGFELFRIARDGTFSEALLATPGLLFEIARRFKKSRAVLYRGEFSVASTSEAIPSLDTESIGDTACRTTIKDNPQRGGDPATSVEYVSYSDAPPPTPPSFLAAPAIGHDGTPRIGETGTITWGLIAGGASALREVLLNGSALSGPLPTSLTFEPGTYRLHEVAEGPGGQTPAFSDPVVVPVPAPSISFGTLDIVKLEGNSGTAIFSAPINLTRDGSTAALGYTWQVVPAGANAANAADFGGALPDGSGSFASGQTSKTITFLVGGDTAIEPNETFQLAVTLTGYNTITANGTIVNDDTTVPSAFTMTQLADSRIYQRNTDTGGGMSKGQGLIPVQINVTAVGDVYARTRAAGGTVLQAGWKAATLTATGVQTLQVTGVDVRDELHYLDLSGDGGATWKLGTTLVGVGVVMLVWGQSLADLFLGENENSYSAGALGLPAPPTNCLTFVGAYNDSTLDYTAPVWRPPYMAATGGTLGTPNSPGIVRMLTLLHGKHGCNIAIAGANKGGTSVSGYFPSTVPTPGAFSANLGTLMEALGGWEYVYSIIGHNDATSGTKGKNYKTGMTYVHRWMTSKNARGRRCTIVAQALPNVSRAGYDLQACNSIRKACYEWVTRDASLIYSRGVYVNSYTFDLRSDGVHPTGRGNVQQADLVYAGIDTGTIAAGDDQVQGEVPSDLALQGPSFSAAKFKAQGLSDGYGRLGGGPDPYVGEMSVGFWLLKPNAGPGNQIYFGYGWFPVANSDGTVTIKGPIASPDPSSTASLVSPNWQWVVFEFNRDPLSGGPTIALRVNGQLIIPPTPTNARGESSIWAVRGSYGGGNSQGLGTFSEFTIWNRLLGDWVPTGPIDPASPGLRSYWPLNGDGLAAV